VKLSRKAVHFISSKQHYYIIKTALYIVIEFDVTAPGN